MKLLSETEGLRRLSRIRDNFRQQVRTGYEHRAKDCLTCEVQGSCCTDAHFVNVHISKLEAVAIGKTLDCLPVPKREAVWDRVSDSVRSFQLDSAGDTFSKTYACPLFEPGVGCLVHCVGDCSVSIRCRIVCGGVAAASHTERTEGQKG